ncbi:MAG: BMP family ABC transporter substrate-binding protein [bacterium]|nr:BMP family ABC transporter substrate-binding protein [bacterium]
MKRLCLAVFAALFASSFATAGEIAPAVVYDLGGKFDKSFNEGVYDGAAKFTADTGIDFREFEVQTDSQRVQALRSFARRGLDPILAVGFQYASALDKVAPGFPDTRFAIIDAVVDQPNVQSIVFKEHEGSFVVGVLAAMAADGDSIGFVGGMDVPLIRRFACGYVLGARHARPGIRVFQNMTGTTGAAWNDPVKGGELAKSQFDRGASVVYHAAGSTGLGVLQAAADAGRLAIGVDSNQNHLHPGHILTSMLKRVDVAAYDVFDSARRDEWRSGVRILGLKENGVGWSLDAHNEALVTPAMKAAADEAARQIVSGEIKVHDYVTEGDCPAR